MPEIQETASHDPELTLVDSRASTVSFILPKVIFGGPRNWCDDDPLVDRPAVTFSGTGDPTLAEAEAAFKAVHLLYMPPQLENPPMARPSSELRGQYTGAS